LQNVWNPKRKNSIDAWNGIPFNILINRRVL